MRSYKDIKNYLFFVKRIHKDRLSSKRLKTSDEMGRISPAMLLRLIMSARGTSSKLFWQEIISIEQMLMKSRKNANLVIAPSCYHTHEWLNILYKIMSFYPKGTCNSSKSLLFIFFGICFVVVSKIKYVNCFRLTLQDQYLSLMFIIICWRSI